MPAERICVKKFSKAERNLEEEAFVAPDVANHVLKLVKPVQQVEQVLLWPGDSVKSEDTDTSAPIMIQNILGHAWRQEWRGRGCEL